MGAWGVGLYQDDGAADLKASLATLFRLPIDISDFRAALNRGEADEGGGVVYSLVLADFLERKGHHHTETFQKAIAIIRDGADIDRLRALQMSEGDLRGREKILADLLGRLENPRPEKPRKTLKSAKRVPVSAGDAVVYPANSTGPVNPYFTATLLQKIPFNPTHWAALIVVEVGYAYDYLPWVGVQRITQVFEEKPGLAQIGSGGRADIVAYGTLSPAHFRKMGMEKVGVLPVPDAFAPLPHGHAGGRDCAIHDISISNRL